MQPLPLPSYVDILTLHRQRHGTISLLVHQLFPKCPLIWPLIHISLYPLHIRIYIVTKVPAIQHFHYIDHRMFNPISPHLNPLIALPHSPLNVYSSYKGICSLWTPCPHYHIWFSYHTLLYPHLAYILHVLKQEIIFSIFHCPSALCTPFLIYGHTFSHLWFFLPIS